ncbi:MAG: aldo/keto reductase [bacterium]|nr:aldo/keto reductase [bacterium]
MQYRKLGNSDLTVSNLCLGTMTMGWANDETESHQILDRAVEAGITFIDTADIYSRWVEGNPGGVSETYIGNWLKRKRSIGSLSDKLVIATKVRGRMWEGEDGEGLSERHIMRAVEDSLRRLQIETIDLYQCHAPDPNTPIEETWHALAKLVRDGKVRWLGLSNFSGAQHREIIAIADRDGLPRPVSTQPKYNLTVRNEVEVDLLPVVKEANIGMIPYSPLEGGLLTGKYRPNATLPDRSRHTLNGRAPDKLTPTVVKTLGVMDAIAKKRRFPLAQIALAWMLARDWMTSPIIGATSIKQLEESLPASDIKLSKEEVAELDVASWEEELPVSFGNRT